jgi:arylsulfatase A-like enzyme
MDDGPEGEYLTDRLTDATIAFIEDNSARPFFAFLSFHTVHTPLQAKPEVVEKYRRKIQAMDLATKQEPDKREKRFQNNPAYAAMVQHMDENIGRLLEALRRLDLERDTIVVFTSDNGGKGSETSNLPLRGVKHNLYEGGIRVPLIVRWPGRIEAGHRSDTPLISNDFYPTLLDLAGCSLEADQHVDGVTFAPILMGQRDDTDREALYWHYPHSKQEGAIRVGRYKLLERFETGELELYDLEADIGERHNLSAERPALANRMLAMLKDWQSSVGARFDGDGR